MDFSNLQKNSESELSKDAYQMGKVAQQMKKLNGEILQSINRIKECVEGSKYYWLTDSAHSCSEKFFSDILQIGDIEENINKQMQNLDNIIGLADSYCEEYNNAVLPQDIID